MLEWLDYSSKKNNLKLGYKSFFCIFMFLKHNERSQTPFKEKDVELVFISFLLLLFGWFEVI
jgi:ammonia channel protein AmtB